MLTMHLLVRRKKYQYSVGMHNAWQRFGILYVIPFGAMVVVPILFMFDDTPLAQKILQSFSSGTYVSDGAPLTLHTFWIVLLDATPGWIVFAPLFLLFACTQNSGVFATTPRYRRILCAIMLPLFVIATAYQFWRFAVMS